MQIKNYLLSTLLSGLIFTGCQKDQINETIQTNTDSPTLTSEMLKFESFDSFFADDNMSGSLKSSKQNITSLEDVLDHIESLIESDNEDELKEALDTYKDVIWINEEGDPQLVVENPLLQKTLNEEGAIQIGTDIYQFKQDEILIINTENNSIISESRDIEIPSSTTSKVVTKKTPWSYERGVNVSSHRRITFYKFVEFNSNFGIYVGGRIYYKKKRTFGGWKRCNTDLKMEYEAQNFIVKTSSSTKEFGRLITQDNCNNDHQLKCGTQLLNIRPSSEDINFIWHLYSPTIRFWRNKEGNGTAYVDYEF